MGHSFDEVAANETLQHFSNTQSIMNLGDYLLVPNPNENHMESTIVDVWIDSGASLTATEYSDALWLGHNRMMSSQDNENLGEWLGSEGWYATTDYNRLRLFKLIVQLVDAAHSQGNGLLDLRPSSFELMEDGNVKYVGRILLHDELSNNNNNNNNGEEMEKEWYAFPEGFDNKDLPSFNVFCLGLLLFELMRQFESLEARNAAMVDLRRWILPPQFVSWGSNKEAEFCLWLLNPEPSFRPTTRIMLESELLNEVEVTIPSDEDDDDDDEVDDIEPDQASCQTEHECLSDVRTDEGVIWGED